MAGKQAKILNKPQEQSLLRRAGKTRNPIRDKVIVLLSAKAGLRAGEIAKLTWPMVLTAGNQVARSIELHDNAAKKRSGRIIPLNPLLRAALLRLRKLYPDDTGPVIRSERGAAMRPRSIVNWFALLYRELGLAGCSSHSGRRTFITRAARLVSQAGGSPRDVQQLAGHRSIEQTQSYIDGSDLAKRRVVARI